MLSPFFRSGSAFSRPYLSFMFSLPLCQLPSHLSVSTLSPPYICQTPSHLPVSTLSFPYLSIIFSPLCLHKSHPYLSITFLPLCLQVVTSLFVIHVVTSLFVIHVNTFLFREICLRCMRYRVQSRRRDRLRCVDGQCREMSDLRGSG